MNESVINTKTHENNKQRDKWLHKAENYKYCKKEYSKLLDLVEVMPKA